MTPLAERWQGLEEPSRVDTSEREPVFLLTGRNGSRLRLSASAYQLLRLKQSGVPSEDIAAALGRKGRQVTAAEIDARYQELLERIEKIELAVSDNPLGFWFRVRLLPETLVARLAARLQAAFAPGPAAALLLVITACLAALAFLPPAAHTGSAFWPGYGLLLLSLVVHELGHASACARFGVRPGEIGATLYLIYPALYSDVSGAWQLPRRQRVLVDLGGMYFQLVAGAAYAAAYALSGWEPLRVAVFMILGTGVFSLNPIFKFDGYWVLADTLGVTNLSRQPSRILGHYYARLRGRPAPPLPWSGRITGALAVYSVLSFAVWGVFLWRLGPHVWRMVMSLPPQVAGLTEGVTRAQLSSLLASLFMAGLTLFIAWRLVRSLATPPVQAAARWLARRRGTTVGLEARRETP